MIFYTMIFGKNSQSAIISKQHANKHLGKKLIFSNIRGQNFLKGVDFRQSLSWTEVRNSKL